MLRFIYFLYLNRNNFSFSFIFLSFYRTFKRRSKRFAIIDRYDKVFLFFAFSNLMLGFFALWYLENPSLKIFDTYFVHTIFLIYLYILTKKLFFEPILFNFIIFLMSGFPLITIVFGLLGFITNDFDYFKDANSADLSMLMQIFLKTIGGLYNFLETNFVTHCQPFEPVKPTNSPTLPKPSALPPLDYGAAFIQGVERGCMAAGLSSVFRFHPRVSAVVFVGVGSVSFIDTFYTFKKD